MRDSCKALMQSESVMMDGRLFPNKAFTWTMPSCTTGAFLPDDATSKEGVVCLKHMSLYCFMVGAFRQSICTPVYASPDR